MEHQRRADLMLLLATSFWGISNCLTAICLRDMQPLTLNALYYRVVVIRAPLQGLCYNVKDAVDWFATPTVRRFTEGSDHSPLRYC